MERRLIPTCKQLLTLLDTSWCHACNMNPRKTISSFQIEAQHADQLRNQQLILYETLLRSTQV